MCAFIAQIQKVNERDYHNIYLVRFEEEKKGH